MSLAERLRELAASDGSGPPTIPINFTDAVVLLALIDAAKAMYEADQAGWPLGTGKAARGNMLDALDALNH